MIFLPKISTILCATEPGKLTLLVFKQAISQAIAHNVKIITV